MGVQAAGPCVGQCCFLIPIPVWGSRLLLSIYYLLGKEWISGFMSVPFDVLFFPMPLSNLENIFCSNIDILSCLKTHFRSHFRSCLLRLLHQYHYYSCHSSYCCCYYDYCHLLPFHQVLSPEIGTMCLLCHLSTIYCHLHLSGSQRA